MKYMAMCCSYSTAPYIFSTERESAIYKHQDKLIDQNGNECIWGGGGKFRAKKGKAIPVTGSEDP
jgi:hypothetical protein